MARPRSFDQDAVLRTARDQFWSTGYAGTKVDDIAAATGLGKGSLYGAFGDKHALFLRVFDDYCTTAADATRAALEGPDDEAYERLSAHVHAIAAGVDRRGCLLAKSTAELAEHDEAVQTCARRTYQSLREHLTASIAAAQRAGDVGTSRSAEQLADLLLAVLRGIEALGKGGTEPAALQAIADTALALLPKP